MQETVGSHPLWHLGFMPAPFNTVHADTVVITWIAMALALLIVGFLAATHPVTVVSKRYSVMELIVSYLAETTTGILGRNGLPFVPFIISLFLFILLMNEVGLFPLIGKSPTADLNTTAALSVTTILLIQIVGIVRHGPGYYKHLVIKPLGLGILMLPIVVVDELARPVTLAMRLFGNIFAGEVLLVVTAAVIGAGVVLVFHWWLAIGIVLIVAAIAVLLPALRQGRRNTILAALAVGILGMVALALGIAGKPFIIPLSKIANAFPLVIYIFNLIIGVIQAAVFTLLTIAYLITPTQESTEH